MSAEALVLAGTMLVVAGLVLFGTRRRDRGDQVTDYKQRNGWEQ